MSSTWPLCPDGAATSFLEHAITCHPLALAPFRVVELRALRSEYGVWLAGAPAASTPTGCLVCRNRRPYPPTPVTWDRHSEHAHGTSIDVNWDDNPLRIDGVLSTDFDRFGWEDGCDWLAAWLDPPVGLPVFFRWGGGWTTDLEQAFINLRHAGERIRWGVVDGMHFELALSPAEVKAYDWRALIEEEEAVNKQMQDAIRFVDRLRDGLKPGKDQATVDGAAQRVADSVTWTERQREAVKAAKR